MRTRKFRVPSPAMVVALIALLVGLGGGAYAAKKIKLGKNTVKTKNIKNEAVTDQKLAKDVRGKAVAWAEVAANGSITAARGLSASNFVKSSSTSAFTCAKDLPEHGTATVSPVFAGDAHEFGFPAVAIDEAPFAGGDGTCTGVSGAGASIATYFLGLGTTASSYSAQPYVIVLQK